MKNLFLAMIMVGATISSFAQTDKDVKKIEKCYDIFQNKSMTKGIEKLQKHMAKKKKKSWPSVYAYEVLVEMQFQRYAMYQEIYDLDEVSLVNDAGETDSSTYFLYSLMGTIYEVLFINTCEKATMESRSQRGDMYYRKLFLDQDPDTAVSEKAQEYFAEAEEFFGKEDYELAELNYRKALLEDSTYYKALLYLGDSFWAREDYDSAIVYYTQAKEMHPFLIEPRKYIVDALIEQELYYRAKKECLEALTVFPGHDMKYKYRVVLSVENKDYDDHRMFRFGRMSFNDMSIEDQSSLEGYGPWEDYRNAKSEISKYCDEDGFIEPNGVTEDKYLEVYSIRYMLEQNKGDLPEYMHFASQMMEEGYLEPYVFISNFHFEIYDQFKDYMSSEENRKKSMEFVEKYCIIAAN